MFDFSPVQILIVLAIALLVFGPKRLPEMGRSIGRGIREFKGAISLDEPPERPAAPRAAQEPYPAATPAATPHEAAPHDDDVLDGVIVPGDAPPRAGDHRV